MGDWQVSVLGQVFQEMRLRGIPALTDGSLALSRAVLSSEIKAKYIILILE